MTSAEVAVITEWAMRMDGSIWCGLAAAKALSSPAITNPHPKSRMPRGMKKPAECTEQP